MKVLNIHKRKIDTQKEKILELFPTVATEEDRIWPKENWPKMKLNSGLQNGSKGGHGPIRYEIVEFKPESHIVFKFQEPKGFNGIHKFEVSEISENQSQITHTIDMRTSFWGTIQWLFAVRWLHDALIEDALDKVQNQLTQGTNKTKWNPWVKFLRAILK